MAFFTFRWPGQSEPSDPPGKRSRTPQTESIEVMRRRARHRLMGAAVLVLLGVVGFPLLFDTQPRPIPVDIPIEIPDRNKVAPLVVPAEPDRTPSARAELLAAKPGASVPPRPAAGRESVQASLAEGEEVVSATRSPAKPVAKEAEASAAPKSEPKKPVLPVPVPEPKKPAPPAPEPKKPVPPAPEPKKPTPPAPEPKKPTPPAPEPKKPAPEPVKPPPAPPAPEPKKAPPAPAPERKPAASDDSARPRALLEGRPAESAAVRTDDERFIVQVGAFADAEKAREARGKLERAGLKTYTQVVETKDGKRTRVRVGPFANRAEADKAAARVKGLDLSAAVQPF
ncbi:MAG: SPOR domain-containing protein [Burkholderiaceae bacterium]|nr:SPOR domain-containing protein [Burkholderiaceae bacterium]